MILTPRQQASLLAIVKAVWISEAIYRLSNHTMISFVLCLDWTIQLVKKTKRLATNERREKYYEEMKRNMKFDDEPGEYFSTRRYIKTKTVDECTSRITRVSHDIYKLRIRKLEYYAVLGIELTNLKVMYIKNKCDLCREMDDIYEILDCRNCVNHKNRFSNEYVKKVQEIIQHRREYINFCIWIGRLYLKYANFRYVTESIDVIKNKLTIGFLSARMAEDAEFWRSK